MLNKTKHQMENEQQEGSASTDGFRDLVGDLRRMALSSSTYKSLLVSGPRLKQPSWVIRVCSLKL